MNNLDVMVFSPLVLKILGRGRIISILHTAFLRLFSGSGQIGSSFMILGIPMDESPPAEDHPSRFKVVSVIDGKEVLYSICGDV